MFLWLTVESTGQWERTFPNAITRWVSSPFSSSCGSPTWCSVVQHRYPGDLEMEGTARWEGKGQLSALGNAVAWGYNRFNKTEDSPHKDSGLYAGANISCQPTAASELSNCVFRNWKVTIDPWFHIWWRCEQIIKYLWEFSPPDRPIIPTFSTFSLSFPPIAGSRQAIYGLHRDYALSTLSSKRPNGVSCTLRNMSYQTASSNFFVISCISCICRCLKAQEASTAETGGRAGSRFCFTSQALKWPISHLETCQNTFPNRKLFLLSEFPTGYLDIPWCHAFADVSRKGKIILPVPKAGAGKGSHLTAAGCWIGRL